MLELVRRGFRFLSDEAAAIDRLDHKVYPYPRSLMVRSGTFELTGISRDTSSAPTWFEKTVVDIEEIVPLSLGDPTSIHHIVFLHNSASGDVHVYQRIRIQITCDGAQTKNTVDTPLQSPAFEELLQRTLVNYPSLNRPSVSGKTHPQEIPLTKGDSGGCPSPKIHQKIMKISSQSRSG